MNAINDLQKLQLALIERASFNDFNGPQVVESLHAHRELWKAVMMTRLGDLIPLRDLAAGHWNADELYLLPTTGNETALEKVARTWKPDELNWIGSEKALELLGTSAPAGSIATKILLRLWWD